MTNSIKKSLGVAAVGAVLALSLGQAQAAPTPVAGVIVGGPSETTFKFSNLTETFVTGVGDTLSGFGRVSQINNLFGESFCSPGPCELTYTFDDYVVSEFDTSATLNTSVFSGGVVNFYVDTSPDANLATTTGLDDGTLWLSAVGFSTTETSGPNAGSTGSLFSAGTAFADSENIIGNGNGLLRITGGAAGDYFGLNNLITLSSSFQQANPDLGFILPLAGTAELQVIAQQQPPTEVPEPATIALLGAGLLGLGVMSRKRKLV